MHRPKAAKKEIPALKKEAKSAPAVVEPASADSADKSKLSKNQLKKLAKKEKDGEFASTGLCAIHA